MNDFLIAIGLSIASLSNGITDCKFCEDGYQYSDINILPSLSVEARGERFGLMLSSGWAEREAEGVAGPKYFAAKGDPSGEGLTAHITQSVEARWVALQGTYTHDLGPVGLRFMAGMARVRGFNHERGTYDYGAGPYWVEHRNDTKEYKPIYGLGLEYNEGDWLARAEFQMINNAVESYWTRSNRISALNLQVGRVF